MTDLVRATWLERVFGSTLIGFTAALAALLTTGPGSALVVAPTAVVLVLGLWTTRSLTAAMADGNHGEMLLRDGTRLPVAALQRSWLVDRTEPAVWCLTASVIAALLVIDPSAVAGVALLGAVICGALLWNIRRARALNRRLFRAQLAVQDGRLSQATTLLAPLLGRANVYAAAAESLRASVRIRTGDIAGGIASEARRWRGTLDITAATVALHRLAAGDRELADTWLDTFVGSDRYSRYLRALVSGHLHLVDRDWAAAIEAARDAIETVPAFYANELLLIVAAAQASAGDAPASVQTLASVAPAIETEPWRQTLYPALWAALFPDATPVAPPLAAPRTGGEAHGSPFAAPRSAPTPQRARSAHVGLMPLDWIAVTQRSNRRPMAALGMVAIGMAAVVPLAVLVDHPDGLLLPLALGVCALAVAIGAPLGLRVWLETRPTDGPAVVTTDGRRIDLRRFGPWSICALAPLATIGALVGVGPPAVELATQGSAWMLLASAPVLGLFTWLTLALSRSLRLVADLHGPLDDTEAVCERAGAGFAAPRAQARIAGGLMALWRGEVERAEATLGQASMLYPVVGPYVDWIRAARGEVSLDAVLDEPVDDDLAVAWRHAVLVGIAALSTGQSARIADRVHAWDDLVTQLPNRFGGLLWRVGARVREAQDLPASPLPCPDQDVLTALAETWAFLGPQSDRRTSGSRR